MSKIMMPSTMLPNTPRMQCDAILRLEISQWCIDSKPASPTSVQLAPGADRPCFFVTYARSGKRAAPRAPSRGEKCIPGGVPKPPE